MRLITPTGAARDDLVFAGERGEYLDNSALRRRYKDALKRAGIRPLRFHDLRHIFGSIAINQATIVQVQAWMGRHTVTDRYGPPCQGRPRGRQGHTRATSPAVPKPGRTQTPPFTPSCLRAGRAVRMGW